MKLGYIAEVKNGSTPSTKESDNYDGYIIWITPKDLSDQMEAIVYHIAASNIDDELLLRIMVCVVDCHDFDERLKIDIINAMQKGDIKDN